MKSPPTNLTKLAHFISAPSQPELHQHGRHVSLRDNECILSIKLQKALHQVCPTLRTTRRRVKRQQRFIHLFILQQLSERKKEEKKNLS